MGLFRPRDARRVVDLPVSKIVGNPYQPRRDVDEKHLRQLTQSIAAYGVIVPIIVRPRSKRGEYELVAGQRRLLACRRLGWKHVPAVVRHYDDQQVMEVGLLENIQRHNLSSVEEVEALSRLGQEFVRMSRDELARKMGVDPGELKRREDLLGLSMVTREAVITGLITTEHALALLPLDSEEEQIQALTRIHREDLSVTATRRMVESLLAGRRAPRGAPPEAPAAPDAGNGSAWDGAFVERLAAAHETLRGAEPPALGGLTGLADDLLAAMRARPPGTFLDLTYREGPERMLARHSWNVAKLSVFLGDQLAFPAEDLRTVALSGLLYDAGMLDVPAEILSKAGSLSEEELARIRRHPEEGSSRLQRIPGLSPLVARVALEHHERSDGSGYPGRTTEGQLHPHSRLVAVADCFEAASAPRAYRAAASPRMTMQAIVLNTYRGTFDRAMVRAFLQALSLYPVGSLVRLGTGELARVVRSVPTDVTRPVVQVLQAADGSPVVPPREINLAESPGVTLSDDAAEPRETQAR